MHGTSSQQFLFFLLYSNTALMLFLGEKLRGGHRISARGGRGFSGTQLFAGIRKKSQEKRNKLREKVTKLKKKGTNLKKKVTKLKDKKVKNPNIFNFFPFLKLSFRLLKFCFVIYTPFAKEAVWNKSLTMFPRGGGRRPLP